MAFVLSGLGWSAGWCWCGEAVVQAASNADLICAWSVSECFELWSVACLLLPGCLCGSPAHYSLKCDSQELSASALLWRVRWIISLRDQGFLADSMSGIWWGWVPFSCLSRFLLQWCTLGVFVCCCYKCKWFGVSPVTREIVRHVRRIKEMGVERGLHPVEHQNSVIKEVARESEKLEHESSVIQSESLICGSLWLQLRASGSDKYWGRRWREGRADWSLRFPVPVWLGWCQYCLLKLFCFHE